MLFKKSLTKQNPPKTLVTNIKVNISSSKNNKMTSRAPPRSLPQQPPQFSSNSLRGRSNNSNNNNNNQQRIEYRLNPEQLHSFQTQKLLSFFFIHYSFFVRKHSYSKRKRIVMKEWRVLHNVSFFFFNFSYSNLHVSKVLFKSS